MRPRRMESVELARSRREVEVSEEGLLATSTPPCQTCEAGQAQLKGLSASAAFAVGRESLCIYRRDLVSPWGRKGEKGELTHDLPLRIEDSLLLVVLGDTALASPVRVQREGEGAAKRWKVEKKDEKKGRREKGKGNGSAQAIKGRESEEERTLHRSQASMRDKRGERLKGGQRTKISGRCTEAGGRK